MYHGQMCSASATRQSPQEPSDCLRTVLTELLLSRTIMALKAIPRAAKIPEQGYRSAEYALLVVIIASEAWQKSFVANLEMQSLLK